MADKINAEVPLFVRVGERKVIATSMIRQLSLNQDGSHGWLIIKGKTPYEQESIKISANEFYTISDLLVPYDKVRNSEKSTHADF